MSAHKIPPTVLFLGEPMTRREVLIARSAFDEGLHLHLSAPPHRPIKERYPLPQVERTRVVLDPVTGTPWCERAGRIAVKDSAVLPAVVPTPERVKLWADLLANPTEMVEDESP